MMTTATATPVARAYYLRGEEVACVEYDPTSPAGRTHDEAFARICAALDARDQRAHEAAVRDKRAALVVLIVAAGNRPGETYNETAARLWEEHRAAVTLASLEASKWHARDRAGMYRDWREGRYCEEPDKPTAVVIMPRPTPVPGGYASHDEAARFLTITPKTLSNLCWQGAGPPRVTERGGRRISPVYPWDSLTRWAAGQVEQRARRGRPPGTRRFAD